MEGIPLKRLEDSMRMFCKHVYVYKIKVVSK